MRRLLAALAGLALAAPAYGAPVRPDPYRERQWGLDDIHVSSAVWRASRGRGVVIAVVDTGVDLAHPDLKAKLVPGFDVTAPGAPPVDHNGHGTLVAGIAAAATGNGLGIAGVAPDARIMPVKVLGPDGRGSVDGLARGIRWAADHRARVINLSLGLVTGVAPPDLPSGAPDPLDPIREAVAYAWSRGAVVVAAAGNRSVPACTSPAVEAHVVCVGALDRRDVRSYYSQGDGIEQHDAYLCAPGGSSAGYFDGQSMPVPDEDVLSTVARGSSGDFGVPAEGYGYGAGTSMAAPYVSGVAALLLARGLRNDQVVARLLSTAVDLGAPGRDGVFGYGKVDAKAALGV